MNNIVSRILTAPLLMGIHIYRWMLSPLLPPACRFIPSCSEYALTALKRYGFFKGGWLSLRRIMRCHPFGAGGIDPVP